MLDKYKSLLHKLQAPSQLKLELKTLYLTEYEENFETILTSNETDFLNNLSHIIKTSIIDQYSQKAFENFDFNSLFKTIQTDFYTQTYLNDKSFLSSCLSNNDLTETKLNSKHFPKASFNFLKHCIYQGNIPYHNCTNSTTTPFTLIKKANSLYGVYCSTCKYVYKSSCIKLYCDFCDVTYYSCIQHNEDNSNLQPVTWEKYHCNLIMNEQMKCIQCKSLLYIDIKKDMLLCKRCNFISEPNGIIWKCVKCGNEFHSDAKIYNKYEYKPMAIAVKKGLADKQQAAPLKLPCGHEGRNVRHNKECQGELYLTFLNERKMVLCNKCKGLTKYERFVWVCNECNKRFRDIKVNSNINDIHNEVTDSKSSNKYLTSNRSVSTTNTDSNKSERMAVTKNILKSTLGIDVKESKRNNKSLTNSQLNSLHKTISPETNRSIEHNNKSINNDKEDNVNVSLFSNNKQKNKLITSLHKGIPTHPTIITQNDLISNHVNSTQHEILRAMQHRHFNSNRNNKTSLLTNHHHQYKSEMIAHHQFKSRDSIPLRIVHKSINSSKSNHMTNSIPKFDLNNYDVISQISQGRNSKVLCVKEQNTNNFFAIKKDFLLKQIKEELIHNIYIQYLCSKRSSFIVNINALHEGNEEISTLQELGINNYSTEIAANRKIRKIYKEIELVKLIYHITEAMIVVNDNGYTHFNIHPKTIIIFNHDDNKQFKLSNFDNIKNISPNTQYIITPKELTSTQFISPQRYACAYLNNNKQITNKHFDLIKSDVYSLGLLILYLMLPSDDLSLLSRDLIHFDYNAKMKEANYIKQKVNKYLSTHFNKRSKHNYSDTFVNLLCGMLHINESKRLSFKEIKQFIQKYYYNE